MPEASSAFDMPTTGPANSTQIKDLAIYAPRHSGGTNGSLDAIESNIIFEYPEVLKPYHTAFNSMAASAVATSSGFPLDSIKTRLQTYPYNGNWHCVVDTYKNEGVLGFFRGLAAPLVSGSLIRSWLFSVYTHSKPYSHAFWSKLYQTDPLPSTGPLPESYHNLGYVLRAAPISYTSGALAGLACAGIAGPFELTKLASQIELVMKRREFELQKSLNSANGRGNLIISPPSTIPLGSLQIAKRLVAQSGTLSLFSGFKFQVIRDTIGCGIYFAVYDSMKLGLSLYFFNTQSHPISVAIAGGLSGACSWLLIYPIDTIKSQYQRDIMSHFFAGKPASERPGMPALKFKDFFRPNMYNGLGVSLLRTSVLGLIMFSCFEKLMEVTA